MRGSQTKALQRNVRNKVHNGQSEKANLNGLQTPWINI